MGLVLVKDFVPMYQGFQVRFENDQLIIEASEAAATEHFPEKKPPTKSQ